MIMDLGIHLIFKSIMPKVQWVPIYKVRSFSYGIFSCIISFIVSSPAFSGGFALEISLVKYLISRFDNFLYLSPYICLFLFYLGEKFFNFFFKSFN